MSKQSYIDKAMDWVSKKSTLSVKAKVDGYDEPRIFRNKSTDEEVQSDISFVTMGGATNFSDIAIKTDKPQKLVTRWKLLSLIASMKKGKLHLLAPKGHKMFTQRLIDKYNINAIVHSL